MPLVKVSSARRAQAGVIFVLADHAYLYVNNKGKELILTDQGKKRC